MTTNSTTGCISHISIVQDKGVVLQWTSVYQLTQFFPFLDLEGKAIIELQRKYRSQLRVMSIQVMRGKKKNIYLFFLFFNIFFKFSYPN
jgi:hypothetical protein